MKTRKNIARLLSFLMVLSLLLGISAAPVYAVGGEGETASFEIREANPLRKRLTYEASTFSRFPNRILESSASFITASNFCPKERYEYRSLRGFALTSASFSPSYSQSISSDSISSDISELLPPKQDISFSVSPFSSANRYRASAILQMLFPFFFGMRPPLTMRSMFERSHPMIRARSGDFAPSIFIKVQTFCKHTNHLISRNSS